MAAKARWPSYYLNKRFSEQLIHPDGVKSPAPSGAVARRGELGGNLRQRVPGAGSNPARRVACRLAGAPAAERRLRGLIYTLAHEVAMACTCKCPFCTASPSRAIKQAAVRPLPNPTRTPLRTQRKAAAAASYFSFAKYS